MIFALAHSGVCVAFSRETGKRLCYLNTQEDEVVRSLFYNKNNDTLITVSVYATDNYSSLKCRSTPLEFIRRGKPEEGGMPLFEEESLQWPGFVEFDDVNGKVLTYNAQKHTYKVFDLKNYNLLYKITDRTVSEIKVSPGKPCHLWVASAFLILALTQSIFCPLRLPPTSRQKASCCSFTSTKPRITFHSRSSAWRRGAFSNPSSTPFCPTGRSTSSSSLTRSSSSSRIRRTFASRTCALER